MNIPTPNEFYVAYHLFRINGQVGWGVISDDFADYSDTRENLLNTRHMDEDTYNPAHYRVVRINLEEGTSRDVTEDVLADVFPEEPEGDDDMPEWQFQRREAYLAGHFA